MNLGLHELPERCDVLVVGAGPAGSAAAQLLARAGRDVVMVDAHAFPRDKVCGDGLIPDAHRALDRLGVLAEVMAEAQAAKTLACISPRAGRVDVPGRLAVLPRKRLDEIVCRAAVTAGARMFAPVRFVAPLREPGAPADGGRVVGATLQAEGRTHRIAARWLVLASGAPVQATVAAGMCERKTPSAIALRGYVRNPAMVSRITALEVIWHRRLSPGYGWVFPCGDGVFNIGVGIASTRSAAAAGGVAMPDVNLRDVFSALQAIYPPARELVDGGSWLGDPAHPLKGAPLRCSLAGARFEAPGMLVTGEAAGATYAFTGEGIGKAMETGMLAAEAIIGASAGDESAETDAAVRARYVTALAELKPRFDLYEAANKANERPWLVDLLIWSARRSPRRLQRMAGVLEETHIPTDAVTWRGVLRRLFDWR